MGWAKRLRRVFGIEIERCARCGGKLKIIASIEKPGLIAKMLEHLARTAPQPQPAELPLGARAPRRRRACYEPERRTIERAADAAGRVLQAAGSGSTSEARHANSLGTDRWFEFPIRLVYEDFTADSATQTGAMAVLPFTADSSWKIEVERP